MSNQMQFPGDEKQEEKERNEKDEKEVTKREEKTVDEKYRRDPLGTMVWAAILIWVGLVFLARNLGWLANLQARLPENWHIQYAETWAVILLGMGGIILVEIVIRLLVPIYRRPVFGSLIFAIILIYVSLNSLIGVDLRWEMVGPVILILIGLSLLLRGFFRKK
jgi:hypothetical protein